MADPAAALGDMVRGPYAETPKRGFVLPVSAPGTEHPPLILIVAASPRLPLDDVYRGFFELLGASVGAALAGVRAREDERARMEARAAIDAERDRAVLRQTERQLAFALEAGRLGSWEIDLRDGTLVASAICREIFGIDPATPTRYADFVDRIDPRDRAWRGEEIERAIRDHADLDLEYRIRRPGEDDVAWVLIRGKAAYDADAAPRRLAGVVFDVTDRKRAEERQRLLLDELNHRVKNTLAIVQSIAAQTSRSAAGPEAFHAALEGRLTALSGTHDLLTRASWDGVLLDDIVALVLQPCRADASLAARIRAGGPRVRLDANAAVTLGLALHELATNAMRYGALSAADGTVSILWAREGVTTDEALVLDWIEAGGPAVDPPRRRGFGSRLLERGLARELSGTVTIDYAPGGVRCAMRFPLSRKIWAVG
jgi:two-component sensor histidine kinase